MPRLLPPLLAALVCVVLAACGPGLSRDGTGADAAAPGDERPTIVVTHAILGALVTELAGDGAEVTVLMDSGADPHDWQPSAKDAERIREADLVVANGAGLEESLEGTLKGAKEGGVPVFLAEDHVELRAIREHGPSDEHGRVDPHLWTDPLAMKAFVSALAVELRDRLGLGPAARAAALERRLDELHAEIESTLSAIPPERRRLVTGHESMGYFAERYGFEVVGAVQPGLSSQAEVSAGELAELAGVIEESHVAAIFTELGAPDGIARVIGEETGAAVVALPAHTLPDDGSYFTFMRGIANEIAAALG